MRIAVVCSDIGVRVPGTKGASIHLAAISTAFAAQGHDVLLVGVAGHGEPPGGFESILLPHPGRSSGLRRELRKLAFTRRMRRSTASAVTAFRPGIVYERLSLFGTVGQHLAAATGACHVLEINALLSEEESAWRSLRLRRLATRRENSVLTSAHVRVAVSDELATRVGERCGLPVHVVPNGVDWPLFAHLPDREVARAEFDLPADAPVIGFTGSIRPWHGVDVAIDALAQIDGAVLAIAGDGDLRADLEQRAADLGVASRVRWFGQVPHDRIPLFLAGLDVAVAPYPSLDHFVFSPLKAYEYLAAGVPVVASEIGQLPAIVGDLGVLVEPGDAAALADALRRVLDDRETAQRAARRGRDLIASHHTWQHRAADIVDLAQAGGIGAVAR